MNSTRMKSGKGPSIEDVRS